MVLRVASGTGQHKRGCGGHGKQNLTCPPAMHPGSTPAGEAPAPGEHNVHTTAGALSFLLPYIPHALGGAPAAHSST